MEGYETDGCYQPHPFCQLSPSLGGIAARDVAEVVERRGLPLFYHGRPAIALPNGLQCRNADGSRLPKRKGVSSPTREGVGPSLPGGGCHQPLFMASGGAGWSIWSIGGSIARRKWAGAQLQPNEVGGIFDMYGNVWNWCQNPDNKYRNPKKGSPKKTVDEAQ